MVDISTSPTTIGRRLARPSLQSNMKKNIKSTNGDIMVMATSGSWCARKECVSPAPLMITFLSLPLSLFAKKPRGFPISLFILTFIMLSSTSNAKICDTMMASR